MGNETVSYHKKDIVNILADLEMIVVSLDRIGSYYSELQSDECNAISSSFLDDWDVARKLANARRILDSAFSRELGEDETDELEREFQDLPYWSINSPKPPKKNK